MHCAMCFGRCKVLATKLTDLSSAGVNEERRRTRRTRPRDPSPSDSDTTLSPPSTHKNVGFTPLSPQSSRTLARHHLEQDEYASDENDRPARREPEAAPPNVERVVAVRPRPRHRRSSDPSSDRPLVRRPRGNRSPVSESESDVEILPDRFDSHGRPLDRSSRRARRWTSRRGDFEYRPRHEGDWNVRGTWGVAGTDNEAVERIVHDVEGVLEGRGSWIRLLRDVFAGVGRGNATQRIEDEQRSEDLPDEERRRRRRRRSR
jgi:hypothetical protein